MGIAGDKLYQIRAREAFPILVRQAHAQSTIFYEDLAKELRMPNPRNLNYVLGCVGHALEDLSRTWKTDIPPIQCLVINKHTGLPGKGIGLFLVNKGDFSKLSRKQQRLLVGVELQRVFSYTKWLDALNEFGLKPKVVDYAKILQKTRDYKPARESEQHLMLLPPYIRHEGRKDIMGRYEKTLPHRS